jgi:nucleoside-diphosphate-sugar epimerase
MIGLGGEAGRDAILITGANGFVGRNLAARLVGIGERVIGTVRREESLRELPEGVKPLVTDDISAASWDGVFSKVCAVVHTAAYVHVREAHGRRNSLEFAHTNVLGSVRLAEAAARQGVERFVFLSSAGVAGLSRKYAYTEDDIPEPRGPYAVSKLEAERALERIGAASSMRVVALRPPLIYGLGAPGNFGRLLQLLRRARGVPLPLGGIENKRSFIFIENLLDAVVEALRSPQVCGSYFVSDEDDLSTTELIRIIAAAGDVDVRLVSIQRSLRLAARLLGGASDAARLVHSFTVSSRRFREASGWSPRFSAAEGIRRSLAVNPQRSGNAG